MTDTSTIKDIVVTAIREHQYHDNPYLSSSEIIFWNDGLAYQLSYAQRDMIEGRGIRALWDALTADSDGDGTIDIMDNFHGFDDSTVVVVAKPNLRRWLN